MSYDLCQVTVIHAERVAQAQQTLPEEKPLAELASHFKLLGDSGRLKILLSLEVCEMCVCDLATLLQTSPSAISHQLRLLRTAGVVEARKEGKVVYYSLAATSLRPFLDAGHTFLQQGDKA